MSFKQFSCLFFLVLVSICSAFPQDKKGDEMVNGLKNFFNDTLQWTKGSIGGIQENLQRKNISEEEKGLLNKLLEANQKIEAECKKGLEQVDKNDKKAARSTQNAIENMRLDLELLNVKRNKAADNSQVSSLAQTYGDKKEIKDLIAQLESAYTKIIAKEEERVKVMKELLVLRKELDTLMTKGQVLRLDLEKKQLESEF